MSDRVILKTFFIWTSTHYLSFIKITKWPWFYDASIELQIRWGTEDNLIVIFLLTHWKHVAPYQSSRKSVRVYRTESNKMIKMYLKIQDFFTRLNEFLPDMSGGQKSFVKTAILEPYQWHNSNEGPEDTMYDFVEKYENLSTFIFVTPSYLEHWKILVVTTQLRFFINWILLMFKTNCNTIKHIQYKA